MLTNQFSICLVLSHTLHRTFDFKVQLCSIFGATAPVSRQAVRQTRALGFQ